MSKLDDQILACLHKPGYKPVKANALAKKLGVSKSRLPEFWAALQRVIETGQIHENRKGLLRPRTAPGLVTGIIKRITSGAGYLIPHDPQPGKHPADIYISPEHMRDAHTGDEALARLLSRRRRGGQRCGVITEILQRATSTFVGAYFEVDGQGYVQVDGTTFGEPVAVSDPGAKGVHPDDKVVIEMLRFPTYTQSAEAVLVNVLGPRGEPGVDELSIIHEFGLPDEFPEKVLDEARLQAEQFDEDELDERLDLTKETLVTIDPADARDFDDAISLSRSGDGHWHLGVHIADVSHFVPPGSRLDAEAQLRGTSVYLPGRVLPMLPEIISNGLASLQKGKLRYAKSVFIEFTPEGIPIHTEFASSAVKVTRRFAYEAVLPIVQDPDRYRSRVSGKVRALLVRMHELAMILRARRFAAGALGMDLPEVKLDFDKNGRLCGAREAEHDESHQMIEEFMLAANIAVATKLSDRGIDFLRRVHGDPDFTKLRAFAQFVTALGYSLKRCQSRPDLQALLIQAKGQPTEHAVNYALLRSMKQAEYTGLDLGHYALAVDDYCHFTSPIRRYPDLTVHRLIDQLIRKRRRLRAPNELELTRLGKQCSATERRAEQAERELIKIRLLRYMVDRVGEKMDAVITGVERFGFFCQGAEIPVEGLVHVSWLSADDHYDYDPGTFSLIGRHHGRQYRLGDPVRVEVVHVDVDRRQLDFRVVKETRRGRKSSATGKRSNTTSSPRRRRETRTGSQKPGRKTNRPTKRKCR